jgi:hypothetical protein
VKSNRHLLIDEAITANRLGVNDCRKPVFGSTVPDRSSAYLCTEPAHLCQQASETPWPPVSCK